MVLATFPALLGTTCALFAGMPRAKCRIPKNCARSVNCRPLVLVFQLFRNPGGGSGTGRIGEDDGGGWVGAEEDFGGC